MIIVKLITYGLQKGATNLMKWLRTWLLELWTIPTAVVVFFLSIPVLRWLDPSSGTYDAGILQKILFAVIAVLVFNGLAWAGMRMVWKEMFKYFQSPEFKTDFNALSPIQKICVGLSVFALYLLVLVILAMAV